jgi:hypothetical protein
MPSRFWQRHRIAYAAIHFDGEERGDAADACVDDDPMSVAKRLKNLKPLVGHNMNARATKKK